MLVYSAESIENISYKPKILLEIVDYGFSPFQMHLRPVKSWKITSNWNQPQHFLRLIPCYV